MESLGSERGIVTKVKVDVALERAIAAARPAAAALGHAARLAARRAPSKGARLGHPDAGAVLAMIGKHASDKTTAKASRRAAYKVSTRRAVGR